MLITVYDILYGHCDTDLTNVDYCLILIDRKRLLFGFAKY